MVRAFKDVKTKEGELITDDEWNFLLDIDEGLGTYWECIRGQDQKRWFVKEAHHYTKLKIRTIDTDAYENLRTTKRGKKYISNIYNYDILTNFRYADEFFY